MIVDIQRRVERMQSALGRIEGRLGLENGQQPLISTEYQVFSQWGEDGIIQYLIRAVPIANPIFVEFGVQDYTESNTRFLLTNNNWSGLVMDGSPEHIATIKRDPIYWRHNLKAECAFIDRENINYLIAKAGIAKDIGLLSVDIDGNDYWVWDALTQVSPRILVLEYNAIFGSEAMVSVPYAPKFQRTKAHYSNLYWGASLAALTRLSHEKGYSLVGCNSAGNNAFYVRNDVLGDLKQISPQAGFVQANFRESRDADGTQSFLDVASARELIGDTELVDIQSNQSGRFRDLVRS
jgi:hypothetical protein